MPDSDELNDQPEEVETPEAPAAPPAPQFVTLEEFRASQAQLQAINETLGALRSLAERQVAPAPAPVAPQPAERELSRTEYIEAVREGNVEVAEKYLAQREAAQERRLSGRIDQLEQLGTTAFSNLNQRTETAGLTYYPKYKKEIDAVVAGLPPAMRAQGGAYKWAHDTVVGQHIDELSAEIREQALRKPAVEEVERVSQFGRTGRSTTSGKDQTPSVYDLGGDNAVQAMEQFREWKNGGTEDDLARKMGYTNWRDYMEKTKEFR